MTLLDEALRLAELGLAVHWLRGPSGGLFEGRGKAPVSKRWQREPAHSPEQLRATFSPWFNLGLHTGAVPGAALRLVGFDIDGAEGFAFLRSRGVPQSPVRTATRKGEHWLFRHPGGMLPTRLRIDKRPVDLLADTRDGGMNLVLPPSRHPTGFVYQPIGGPWTRAQLEALPVYDRAWFPPPPQSVTTQRTTRLSVGPRTLVHARAALEKMAPAIQGQGGARATFIAALMLCKRFGLDESTVFDLLRTHYNPRCVPPWSERDLLRKARDAARATAGPA